ncbi:MAG: tetratricopeptide repeat protein [Phycisphaerae bacterium]|nr:tetratricopeptide repeat protein [Phycisphaerae bacterium]
MSKPMMTVMIGLRLIGWAGWPDIVKAEPAATLLEKGIYAEETKGDLNEALRFYLRITEEAATNRRIAAEAHYRIGMCLLKRGQNEDARQGFDNVIRLYPEQQELVAKAKEQLTKLGFPADEVETPGPGVVRTTPATLANDVPATLKKITVTFDQRMMDTSWSWTQRSEESFPKTAGDPSYDSLRKTCTLPVQLEPGKVYWVGINSPQHTFFQTPDEVPARPYVILFATRSADGKPTPIPEDLAAQAKAINEAAAAAAMGGQVSSTPAVVRTTPAALAGDVPATLKKITVTFDRPMMDTSWSWTQRSEESFPKISGDPSYDSLRKTCTLPVQLEPGKVYWVGINSPQHTFFHTPEKVPAKPYVILFATRSADGKPTPIPEDLAAQARAINQAAQPEMRNRTGQRPATESDLARGWRLWSQGKHAKAEEWFAKATQADPGNANGWQGLGWAQFNQNKTLAAKESFTKCVAIEPTNAAALNGLGWLAKAEGKVDEAMGYWRKAIEASPEATAALSGLATTSMELKKYDDAVRYYEMILKAMPTHAQERRQFEDGLKKAKNLAGRQQISAASSDLLPAPWADGEVMPLRLISAADVEIGSIVYTAELTKANGKDAWRVRSYMSVGSTDEMDQFTDVVAERDSFAPITGRTRNSTMGDFQAVYKPGQVTLQTGWNEPTKTRTIDLETVAFDNEQALYLIRRMPLAEEYRGSFPIFTVMGGTVVECRITVVGKERITAPAGTFDCYKVDLEVYSGEARALLHHLWFSADEHKYLVKYDAGTAVMELRPVTIRKKGEPSVFEDKALGTTLTLPEGWLPCREPGDAGYHLLVRLFGPDPELWAVMTAHEREEQEATARSVAEKDIKTLQGFFKGYAVKPESWKEHKVAGLPAASFVADYEDKEPMVEYRTYILGKDRVYWFVFRAPKDGFEALRPTLDAIVNGLKVQ